MAKRYLVARYPPVRQHAALAVSWAVAQADALRLRADGMVVVIIDADTLDGAVLGTAVALAYDQERFFPDTEGGPV